jgi:hypothetical protein
MAGPTGGDYDAYAREYAPSVTSRERDGAENDPYGILPLMLDLLGISATKASSMRDAVKVTSRGYWRLVVRGSPEWISHLA